MKTNTWMLVAAVAMAAGMGISMSTTTQAATRGCVVRCQSEYTYCWYSCTPGNGACYDMCVANYHGCISDCG